MTAASTSWLRCIVRVSRISLLLFLWAGSLSAQSPVLVLHPAPVLSTLAGIGSTGGGGDGSAASGATLAAPSAVAYDPAGNLYFADTRNHRVRRISTTGTISSVAGTGIQGSGGDGGPATEATMDSPLGLAIAADGTLYIADTRNHCIRQVALDGIIRTVAGNGTPGFSGDTAQATAAQLRNPGSVAIGSLGELYIADTGNHRIRRVALDGTISTVAGNGREEAVGDGSLAIKAGLDSPSGIVFRPSDGALLIADRLNSRIRIVTPDGLIDSLPASAVPVRKAAGVSIDGSGILYIADTGNYRLRAVTPNGSGVLLGSGEQGFPIPGASYNETPLGRPYAVAADATGGIAFSDRDHQQIQHLALTQILFGTTPVGQISPVQTLVLLNGGTGSLTITAISSPANFFVSKAGTCGNPPFTLAANDRCNVAIGFAPVASGAQSGIFFVAAGGAPQRALLIGTAVPAGSVLASSTVLRNSGSLSYIGAPITFNVQVLGGATVVPTGTVHLLDAATEFENATLDAAGTAAFTTASLTAGQHAITAHFDGDLHYSSSDSPVIQQTVVLAPDFTLTPAASSLSIAAGSVGTMQVVLQPINGTLHQAVTLTVDGLPGGATVSNDAPVPLVLASNAVTITLSFKTPAAAVVQHASILFLPLFGLVAIGRHRIRKPSARRVPRCVGLAAALCAIFWPLLLLGGCGGGYLSGPSTSASSAAHTYPVTVTATTTGVTGTPLVHTASFTLVVN